MKIKKQKIKTGKFSLKIKDVNFYNEYYEEDKGNPPIQLKLTSILNIKIGEVILEKEIKNTIFIKPEEKIYKEILLNSKHIILI